MRPTVLTAATVRAAIRDSRDGKRWARADGLMPGLELRAQPSGARWTVRARLHGRQRRWDVGGVCEGDVDQGLLVALTTARARAVAVKERARKDLLPDPLVTEWTSGVSEHRQERLAAEKPAPSWTWERARQEFLDEKFRTRRTATYEDYKRRLERTPEFVEFAGRQVADITREDIACVVARVHGRREKQAEHLVPILSSMWTFLGDDVRRPDTGVAPNLLLRLKPPERTRREVGERSVAGDGDPPDDTVPIPTELAVGRAVAIARAGVFDERASLSILLLAASAQRRRATIGAHRADFRSIAGEVLWSIPPFFRKAASKRRSQLPHQVPLLGWGAAAAHRLDRLAGNEQGYLFPVARARRAGEQPKRPHRDPSSINHVLLAMPAIEISPHGFRRAFATYGRRDLGWARDEPKLILDHLEGTTSTDVTSAHYDLDPQLRRKRELISAWVDWLDHWAGRAVEADPLLSDSEALRELVYRTRYGEEAWRAKLARTRKTGEPLWPEGEFLEAAE